MRNVHKKYEIISSDLEEDKASLDLEGIDKELKGKDFTVETETVTVKYQILSKGGSLEFRAPAAEVPVTYKIYDEDQEEILEKVYTIKAEDIEFRLEDRIFSDDAVSRLKFIVSSARLDVTNNKLVLYLSID